MLRNIKVSIIMGIYNCETTLSDCIDSILNQSYNDWELIMCNDGSTDKTKKIAEEYANRYKYIYLLENDTNMGLAQTLNRCLEKSKGEFIARMDADDLCLGTRFTKQTEFLEKNIKYDLVGSWAILYDEFGFKGIRKKPEFPNVKNMRYGSPFIHPSIMMRKRVYKKLNGYTVNKRTIVGQDTDLWFRFFNSGFKAYNIQEPLIKYHESLEDYKKRSFKIAFRRVHNHFVGFRLLKYPPHYYIFLFKPLISSLIPARIMYWFHKKQRI